MPMGGDSSGRFHSGTLVGNLQDHGGASLPAGGSARVLAGPNRQKAILLEVARKLPVSTNSSSDTIIDLDIGQFGTLSPMFTGVTAYVRAE